MNGYLFTKILNRKYTWHGIFCVWLEYWNGKEKKRKEVSVDGRRKQEKRARKSWSALGFRIKLLAVICLREIDSGITNTLSSRENELYSPVMNDQVLFVGVFGNYTSG